MCLIEDGLNDESIFPITNQPAGCLRSQHFISKAHKYTGSLVCQSSDLSVCVSMFVCFAFACPKMRQGFSLGAPSKLNKGRESRAELLTPFSLSPTSLDLALFYPSSTCSPNKCFISPSNKVQVAAGEAERGRWRQRAVGE